jgi:hypothetical protein
MRNYNTKNLKPYPRVTDIRISVDGDNNIQGYYTEKMAVELNDNQVYFLEGRETTHEIVVPLSDFKKHFQMYDPTSGEKISDATTTPEIVYLSLLAVIRCHQLERDAA